MSKRTKIVKALVEKLKTISKANGYHTDLFTNAYAKLKFWDEVQEFPAVFVTPGSEARDYLPGDFRWCFLGLSLKVYCKGIDDSQDQLELLLEDIESVVDDNRVLVYDTTNNLETTEILIQSITTDEGLLAPYAVGEINLQVRYAIM